MSVQEDIGGPLYFFPTGELGPARSRKTDSMETWFKRQTLANAITDTPDAIGLIDMFSDVLISALRCEDVGDILLSCATPINAEELEWFFKLCGRRMCDSEMHDLQMLHSKMLVTSYFLLDMRSILVCEPVGIKNFRVHYLSPHDLATPNRLVAGDREVLLAMFAEWAYGRPKSRQARSFICGVCEKALQKPAA